MAASKGKISGIYKIISPTGRIYIGQSVDIGSRFYKYRLLHCKGQIRLYNSFIAHGIESHFFEIIEECDQGVLNERERLFQDLFDSCGENGLNCKTTKSVGRSGHHSSQTCANISKGKIGKKLSPEHLANLKKAKQFISEETKQKIRLANIGKKISDSTRNKHRLRMIGNSYTLGVVPINARKVINLQTGEIHESVTIAAISIEMKPRTLRAMLDGQNKNKSNFKFLLS